MLRSCAYALLAVVVLAASLLAFDVEATIKRVDADQGALVFFAKGQDRTARVARDVKVVDAAGKDVAGGLQAKELRAGAVVTLSIEKEGDRPVVRAIRLGKAAAAGPAAPAKDFPLPD